ncbi:hypothetical protein Droror1_Dr00020286 [Drosera rotundifolia]
MLKAELKLESMRAAIEAELKKLDKKEAELLDLEIANCENAKDAMVQLLRIGVACADANQGIRPDMKEVLRRVEEIAELNPNSHEAKTIQLLPSLRDGVC